MESTVTSSKTRKNHTGNFTTTLTLSATTSRIYGHGRTAIASQEAAQRILASFNAIKAGQS